MRAIFVQTKKGKCSKTIPIAYNNVRTHKKCDSSALTDSQKKFIFSTFMIKNSIRKIKFGRLW